MNNSVYSKSIYLDLFFTRFCLFFHIYEKLVKVKNNINKNKAVCIANRFIPYSPSKTFSETGSPISHFMLTKYSSSPYLLSFFSIETISIESK